MNSAAGEKYQQASGEGMSCFMARARGRLSRRLLRPAVLLIALFNLFQTPQQRGTSRESVG